MPILNIQRPSPAGLEVAYVPANGAGDSFQNNGNIHLRVRNNGAADCVVTANCPNVDNFSVYGDSLDKSWTVPGGLNVEWSLGPFSPQRFNDANGRVQIAYSQVDSVTVAVTAGMI